MTIVSRDEAVDGRTSWSKRFLHMPRILLPTDFSENAFQAAAYAARVFGTEGNDYVLVHAFADMGMTNPMLAGMKAEQLAQAKADLAAAIERLRQETGANGVNGRMEYGPLTDVVETIRRKEGADVVVMGRRGLAGASFFGSNTTDMISRGGLPVLAVPGRADTPAPRRILLANDHEEVSGDSLRILRTIALQDQADVKVVHISKGSATGPEHWNHGIYNTALEGVPVSFATYTGDEVAHAIIEAATTEGADMVAILHRQRGFIDRLFNPSLARKLALDSELPLLVLDQR